MSIYGEIKAGDRLVELESKLIAQKNLGPLILAYNATLEALWEGNDLAQREGEFSQAFGASYEISPPISVGIELLHEFVFPEWRDEEKIRNLFVGPNVSYRRGNWFVTVTLSRKRLLQKMSRISRCGQFSASAYEIETSSDLCRSNHLSCRS